MLEKKNDSDEKQTLERPTFVVVGKKLASLVPADLEVQDYSARHEETKEPVFLDSMSSKSSAKSARLF